MREKAQQYLNAGLSCLPAMRDEKRPAIAAWRQYQSERPNGEIDNWEWPRLCLICGAVSGGLEMIDFDQGGELFGEWSAIVSEGLFDRLVIERTPSGGYHVVYRCDVVEGNRKLATRDRKCYIETRGEGGLFLCAPSDGYELIQGDLTDLPRITADERAELIRAAQSLGEVEKAKGAKPDSVGCDRPGDRFNASGDVLEILIRNGWTKIKQSGENLYLRRPGKPSGTWSATLRDDRTFYVFSSNAAPFEPDKAYSPFAVLTMLEHDGDFSIAAATLEGPRIESAQAIGDDVDLSGIMYAGQTTIKPDFPAECIEGLPTMLREAVDFATETAINPQPELSLAALLTCFGACLGRQVMDDYRTRTNLMFLSLAPSGSGKEHPRQIVKQILTEADLYKLHGPERIGSHAGIVTAMVGHPVKIFQIDEIGRLLATMKNADRSPHLFNVATILMQLYSSAGVQWTGDAYADAAKVKTINQPCLCLYGTSTPDTLYDSITPANLTDGLLGRMLVVEADYGRRQKPKAGPVPKSVLDQIKWWQSMGIGGNLGSENPIPLIVAKTAEADARHEVHCDEVYRRLKSDNAVGKAIWGRSPEKAAKLALIYACCQTPPGIVPTITIEAIDWGRAIANYSSRLVIYAATGRVSGSDHESNLLAVYRSFDQEETQRNIQRKNRKLNSRQLGDVLASLEAMGAVTRAKKMTGSSGRPSVIVRKTGEGVGG